MPVEPFAHHRDERGGEPRGRAIIRIDHVAGKRDDIGRAQKRQQCVCFRQHSREEPHLTAHRRDDTGVSRRERKRSRVTLAGSGHITEQKLCFRLCCDVPGRTL